MHCLSSQLWGFNLLLLRLHAEISFSFLCSHSSWGSALLLALPLRVGCPPVSVPYPDRRELKQQLIRSLLLTQAGEKEEYGSHSWNAGWACSGRGWRDSSTAWGSPCVLFGKLALDNRTLAVMCCTGSQGCEGSDLHLPTGLLVAAATAIVIHACLCGLRW